MSDSPTPNAVSHDPSPAVTIQSTPSRSITDGHSQFYCWSPSIIVMTANRRPSFPTTIHHLPYTCTCLHLNSTFHHCRRSTHKRATCLSDVFRVPSSFTILYFTRDRTYKKMGIFTFYIYVKYLCPLKTLVCSEKGIAEFTESLFLVVQRICSEN